MIVQAGVSDEDFGAFPTELAEPRVRIHLAPPTSLERSGFSEKMTLSCRTFAAVARDLKEAALPDTHYLRRVEHVHWLVEDSP